MARREKEVDAAIGGEKELAPEELTKLLIKEFNRDSKEKMAWCLATDADNPTQVKEWISTGSTLLDYAISNRDGGGVPVGKLTEIVGEEASGKSLLCAHIIAECQKRGGLAIYIDTENAAHPPFLKQLGVDISRLVYLQPGTIEEVGEAIEKSVVMARTKAPNKLVLIIWDSIAGTPCQAEIEGNYDPNERVGLMAKALAKLTRKLTQAWGKERIAVVFSNQLKTKFGVIYGDPMGTPGGKAVPYHASVRIRLNRSSELRDESTKQAYGVHTIAKVFKNRLAVPLRRCEFDIGFAHGIDDEKSWFAYLHEAGEVEKAAGWCYYSSFPSGRADPARGGKDRGIQFREKDWSDKLKDETFRRHVLAALDRLLVIRYEDQPRPTDVEIDPESLLDNESVMEAEATRSVAVVP